MRNWDRARGAPRCARVHFTVSFVPEVRCPSVVFYSREDESAFFSWAQRIPGISRLYGDGPEIVLVIRSNRPSDTTLRELLALLHRYGVNSRQLKQFLTEKNEDWFRDPHAYWYGEVFR